MSAASPRAAPAPPGHDGTGPAELEAPASERVVAAAPDVAAMHMPPVVIVAAAGL